MKSMLKNPLNIVAGALGLGMASFVVYFFYKHHGYAPYKGSPWDALAAPDTWVAIILTALLYFGYLFVKTEAFKKKVFSFTYSVPVIFGMFMLIFISVAIEKTLQIGEVGAALTTIPFLMLFYAAVLFIMTTVWYVLGSIIKQAVEYKSIKKPFTNPELSPSVREVMNRIFIGIAAYMVPLLLLNEAHIINTYTMWGLFILVLAAGYKILKQFIQTLLSHTEETKVGLFDIRHFAFVALLMLIAKNVMHVLRPIPIGWDDMGQYMNIPNQIGSLGGLWGQGNQAWSYLMSHGFTLMDSTTLAMLISLLGGIFFVIIMPSLINNWNNEETGKMGIVWTAVMYSLPMTMFQSTLDMKIDPALFAATVLAVYNYLQYIQTRSIWDLSWAFVVAGLAFTIKPTTFMLAFAMFVLLAYRYWHTLGIIAGLLLSFGVLLITGLYEMLKQFASVLSLFEPFAIPMILIGMALLGYVIYRDRTDFWHHFRRFVLALVLFFLPIMPWFGKGIYETLYFGADISFSNIWKGERPNFAPKLESLAEKGEIDEKLLEGLEKPEGKSIDYQRYLGYEKGAYKHLEMPWDQTMNLDQKGRYVEIGFVLLALIPMLSLALPMRKPWKQALWVVFVPVYSLVYYLIFIARWPSDFAFLTNASYGQMVGMSLIFFAIPWVVAYALHLKKKDNLLDGEIHMDKKYYILALFTFIYWMLWFWIAEGIIWYGIGGFAFLFLLLDTMYREGVRKNPYLVWIANTVLILWLVQGLIVNHNMANNKVFTAYASGKVWEEQAFNMILPIYPDIMEKLNEDPNRPVYRIGTFIKYFIENNYYRVISDNSLWNFSYYNSDNDLEETLQRMRALDFKYLVFDLNAATIDHSEEKPLVKKYENFLRFLGQTDQLTLVQNDKGEYLTDSTCLKFAEATNPPPEEFVKIAGGNHDSQKMQYCYQKIANYLNKAQQNGGRVPQNLSFLQDIIKQNNDGKASLDLSRGAVALYKLNYPQEDQSSEQ